MIRREVRRKSSAAVVGDFANSEGTPIVVNTARGDLAVLKDDNTIQVSLIAVSATANLDFPIVAANEMQTLTIAVTGAVVGMPAFAAPPAAFESGFTFCAFVSATDTVKVRIHNNSGGAVDPAAGDWTVYVLK